MTISKYITEFIKNFKNLKIETNHVQDGSDKYGLFKSPSRDRSTTLDGTDTITEYYSFFAKQSGVSNYDRTDSDEWLEELAYWIDDFQYLYDFPPLDNNRRVVEIALIGSPYPFEIQDNEILYQISLSIRYEREREVL